MNSNKDLDDSTQIVFAPPPSAPGIPASIYYVEVPNHLEVQWQWTELPDGNRVVTNYCLVKKAARDLVKT
jgi:hypothetical protein